MVPGPPVIGRTLGGLDLISRVGLAVIAKRPGPEGEFGYNPRASSALRAGDLLIVCGEPVQVEALREALARGWELATGQFGEAGAARGGISGLGTGR